MLGSTVDVSEVDDSGNPTGQVYSTQTINDLGEFSVDFAYRGFVSLEASGFYYNEISGELSSAPIVLRAFHEVSSSGTQTVFVNLITALSYNRVKKLVAQGISFDEASTQAEAELRAGLEIGLPGFDPGEQGTSRNIAGGDTDANAYLFAVSAVVAKAAELRGGPLDARIQELVNGISAGLASEGTLDESVVGELRDAQQALDTAAVEQSLRVRLDELESAVDVPDLDRILDQDFDGQVNVEDCLPRDPLRWTGQGDYDGDGHDHIGCGGDDCDDDNADRFPTNPEVCGNEVDEDCSGAANDLDCDGHDSEAHGGDDCDDSDAGSYPGNPDVCDNGVDNDCDWVADPGCPCPGTGGPTMVRLPEGYCVDSTEVTRGQYQAWLDAGTDPSTGQMTECQWNTSYVPSCAPGANADYPVVCVDWCDAQAYCQAVGKRLCGTWIQHGNAIGEWGNACGSGGGTPFPYGDEYVSGACNCPASGLAPVGELRELPGSTGVRPRRGVRHGRECGGIAGQLRRANRARGCMLGKRSSVRRGL